MPQISKNQLNPETKKDLIKTVNELIASIPTVEQAHAITNALFTRTEQIMLGKRVIAIFLLSKDWTIRDICRALKMSSGTVLRLREKVENASGVRVMISYLVKNKKHIESLERIEKILETIANIIPQKNDMKKRWRSLHA